MTREEALACVQVGIDMAREEARRGASLLAAGEMGIGNTSPSSAITAVYTGASVEEVTGVGSGISSERVRHKAELIRQGIEINRPDPSDPLDVLAKVGGPELGAMCGLMLGGASLRIPVVVDGFMRRSRRRPRHSLGGRRARHAHRLARLGGTRTSAAHGTSWHPYLF